MNKKLLVVVGPTASGKSALGVRLAQKFNGEIISADSRQVYRGLDIGSGKVTKREMMGIPHHLLDVTSPKRRFTVAQYRSRAIEAMASILRQGKLPILVGGTPFYIYSVVDGWTIPEAKPNLLLRKKLEKLPVEKLFLNLKKLDPARAETLRQSSGQAKNKRRLIRALEIVLTTKKPVPTFKKRPLPYPVLFLGLKKTPQELKKRIAKRLTIMLKKGFLKEVNKLRSRGLSWKRIEEFGFEYKYAAWYLQKGISKQEMMQKIQSATEDFARRQMSWFKKDSRIRWVRTQRQAENLVQQWRR